MTTDSWINETLYPDWGQRFLVKRELGQGLRQLLLRDIAQRFGHFAQQLTRPPLLFFQQQFQLILGNHPKVDKYLTDATNGHGKEFGFLGVRVQSRIDSFSRRACPP